MISLQNVNKVYQTKSVETLALNEINLEVEEGAFLAVMGPSGCGKSTLLNVMGLIDEPTDGTVLVNGVDVQGYTDSQLARFRNSHLGFIFQSYHLINDLQVIDNVEIPLLYRKVGRKQRRELAIEALHKVGLQNRMDHFPSELSGRSAAESCHCTRNHRQSLNHPR